MHKDPAVRVASARDMLDFLERTEPGSRDRVWSRMPEASRSFIDRLGRTSWIPLEHDHWLPEAIQSEFGTERSRDCFRLSIPDMVQKPLLEPLVSGMLRIFGKRRVRLVTIIPKGWGLVFRDFCEPRVDRVEDGEIEIVFDDVTPAVREYPVYFTMWEGVCLGMLDLTRSGGSLEYRVAPDRSQVRAIFSWEPGAISSSL